VGSAAVHFWALGVGLVDQTGTRRIRGRPQLRVVEIYRTMPKLTSARGG
jgi:hypothetical protein